MFIVSVVAVLALSAVAALSPALLQAISPNSITAGRNWIVRMV